MFVIQVLISRIALARMSLSHPTTPLAQAFLAGGVHPQHRRSQRRVEAPDRSGCMPLGHLSVKVVAASSAARRDGTSGVAVPTTVSGTAPSVRATMANPVAEL